VSLINGTGRLFVSPSDYRTCIDYDFCFQGHFGGRLSNAGCSVWDSLAVDGLCLALPKVDKPNTMQTSNLNILGPAPRRVHICACILNQTQVEFFN